MVKGKVDRDELWTRNVATEEITLRISPGVLNVILISFLATGAKQRRTHKTGKRKGPIDKTHSSTKLVLN